MRRNNAESILELLDDDLALDALPLARHHVGGQLLEILAQVKTRLGELGSLPLGAAIGFVALASKQELVLPLLGFVFVVEALSVIFQSMSSSAAIGAKRSRSSASAGTPAC